MSQEKEYTGGSVSYYSIDVNAPINEGSDPYTAECQDIIEALKLDFNEGNVLKAIWRRAAARLGRSKKGYDDGLYDAEKIVFYGQRLVAIEQRVKRLADSAVQSVLSGEKSIVEAYVGAVVQDAVEQLADVYGPRDAEGWYAWNGDETIRPAGKVEVTYRTGVEVPVTAENVWWDHRHMPGDIVKWRPYVKCANATKGCLRQKLVTGPYCDQGEPDL